MRRVEMTVGFLILSGFVLSACGGTGGASPVPPPEFPNQEQRISRSPAGSSESGKPMIDRDGEFVYAVWEDTRNGLSDIYFNASDDGGATWGATDLRLDTDPAGAFESVNPIVCCAGLNVYVAWQDARNGQSDIYFNVSADGGLTWLADDIRLDTDPAGFSTSTEMHMACSGNRVYVAWSDSRAGAWDVYVNASEDAGATWHANDVRLDTDIIGTANSTQPRVCASGSRVFVVWEEDRSGVLDIYLNRSLDSGQTWDLDDRRLDTAVPNSSDAFRPRSCCDGALVYVTWVDTRSGRERVRINVSDDSGATWLPNDRGLDTDLLASGSSRNPEIDCVGSSVYVVWDDDRSGNRDVRLNRSADAGGTWLSEDLRIDREPTGSADALMPRISADGAFVYVIWEDDRTGVVGIRLNWSSDAGVSWQADDVRVDYSPLATSDVSHPRLCCDGDRVNVVWRDGRFGAGDIFANVGEIP